MRANRWGHRLVIRVMLGPKVGRIGKGQGTAGKCQGRCQDVGNRRGDIDLGQEQLSQGLAIDTGRDRGFHLTIRQDPEHLVDPTNRGDLGFVRHHQVGLDRSARKSLLQHPGLECGVLEIGQHVRPDAAPGPEKLRFLGVVGLGLDLDELEAIAVFDEDVDANEEVADADRWLEQNDVVAGQKLHGGSLGGGVIGLVDLDPVRVAQLRQGADLVAALGEHLEEGILGHRVLVTILLARVEELPRALDRELEAGFGQVAWLGHFSAPRCALRTTN